MGYLVRSDRKYTDTHEWAMKRNDSIIVGITDYAQKKLKDIVGVELPEVNRRVNRGESVASIESVKTVAEVYSPVSGVIIKVNDNLVEMPELLNRDPYGDGWIFIVKPDNPEEYQELLSPTEYAKVIEKEEKS